MNRIVQNSDSLGQAHEFTHNKEIEFSESSYAEQMIPCTYCGKKFRSRAYLRSHMNVHMEPKFVCTQCNKSFKRLEHLGNHMTSHADERPYDCSNCSKKFKTNRLLMIHQDVHASHQVPCSSRLPPAEPGTADPGTDCATAGPHVTNTLSVSPGDSVWNF